MTDQGQSAWSGAAAGWAAEAERREAGPAGRAADAMLRAVALQPGERVLEVACGAGDVGLRAAELVGADGRVLCTDFADAMVDLVRERAAHLPQVEARVLDAQDPQLGGQRFDVVLCRFGYMLMPEPDRALRASHDALVPGGRLALAVWGPAERNPWLSLKTDAVMAELGAPPPAPGTPGPFALADTARLRELLTRAGFTDVQIEDVDGVREHDSIDEWVADGDGPMLALLSHMTDEQRERVREAAAEGGRRFAAEDGRLRLPASIVVASATAGSTTRR
ncbi:MAG TPA: class I SAM-dependent methyltransferase [Solirubrobacteraceae bacterium]|jgi:SAM-dependent methyltransferase